MDIMAGIIVRKRKAVTALFLMIAGICLFLFFGVQVNYDLSDYLPDNARSTVALKIMENKFSSSVPNARVMLRNVSVGKALEYKKKLSDIKGVSDVFWLDDAEDVTQPEDMMDADVRDEYYKNGNALIYLSVRQGNEAEITDKIYDVIGEKNALEGDAVAQASVRSATSGETLKAAAILVPVILLILLLSTSSWAEPLLFLAAIGVAVIINMGTDFFTGGISYITQAVSPVLQLAVSLDYAIFLLHRFAEMRKEKSDPKDAMIAAMKKSMPAIAASAATTLLGFAALVFMDFHIGADLGMNLAKGIILSFISVTVFLPALTLCMYRFIDRTSHRRLMPEMNNIGRYFLKIGKVCFILVLLLIYPCWLAQSQNNFLYESTGVVEGQRTGQDEAAVEKNFGRSTPVVVLVPSGSQGKEKMLCDDLENISSVTGVLSYAVSAAGNVPYEYVDKEIYAQFYSGGWARIVAYTNTSAEGSRAFSAVGKIQKAAEKYYGDSAYLCGKSANLKDMKNVVEKDNKRVGLIAVLAIGIVLLLTFRSLIIPVLLVLSIKAAIWLNLAIPYFTDTPLNFIGYLVINTVQLGATVDYAILLMDTYMNKRKEMPAKEAIKETLGLRFRSILVSASILSAAGFVLAAVSSNPLVAEMGFLMGRGAVLSVFMTVCFLPVLILISDRLIRKTTYSPGFFIKRPEMANKEGNRENT